MRGSNNLNTNKETNVFFKNITNVINGRNIVLVKIHNWKQYSIQYFSM